LILNDSAHFLNRMENMAMNPEFGLTAGRISCVLGLGREPKLIDFVRLV
jgi:hypothetical protein